MTNTLTIPISTYPYSFFLTPDPDEGGYVVFFPDCPGCLTVGENVEDAIENGLDALKEWLAAEEDQY